MPSVLPLETCAAIDLLAVLCVLLLPPCNYWWEPPPIEWPLPEPLPSLVKATAKGGAAAITGGTGGLPVLLMADVYKALWCLHYC